MAEFEDTMLSATTGTKIAEVENNEIDLQETYNGPWIEKRIEYKTNDRNHHEVIVYGSWNGFRKGEELEYQGKQIYVATIKFPLGSWIYRFQIDKEDWETNNETAKTIKDGVEFNTISIKEKDDCEEVEEEKNEESGKNQHTQVIYDESTQKFVVGKKKRHGRPSMELDLGKDFDDDSAQPEEADDAEEEEEQDVPQENNSDVLDTLDENVAGGVAACDSASSTLATSTTTTTVSNSDGKGRNRKNKNDKKKRKKRKTQTKQQQEQEKEFARKVFVEQLRQQQQHEDEINRVKLLWKQERQARVEMHKKIVKEKNQLSKDVIQLQSEIERLKTMDKIGNFNDNKQIQQLETDKKKYELEIQKCNDELKKTQDQLISVRKEKWEEDKKNLEKNNDLENQKKKLTAEISSLSSTISNLKAQNLSLETSLNAMKETNKQTIDYQSEQFTSVQQRWENEKEVLLKSSQELMKLKNDIVELKKELSTISNARSDVEKKYENEKRNNEDLAKQIHMLNTMLDDCNKNIDKNSKNQNEIENIHKKFENEKLMLQDKINQLNGKLIENEKNNKEAELNNKIRHLENELSCLDIKYNNETKENCELNQKLQSKLTQLQDEIQKKTIENNEICLKNNENQQKIENYKCNETTLNDKISSLQQQVDNDQKEILSKSKEFEDKINEYMLQINNNNEEKNKKLQELENEISKLKNECTNKSKEYNEMEVKNQQLQYNIELETKKHTLEKNEYEKQLTISHQKEERIHANCKTLFSKFQTMREEMHDVKQLKIGQLEEMQKSFQELSPILNKLFQFNQVMIDNLMEKYKRELTLRRKYFNTLQELRGNIRVFCRVRPLLKFELDQGDTSCLKFPFDNHLIVTDEKATEHPFDFDRVYNIDTRQEDVSEDTTEYIQSVMDGYNVSIFAYGQTGSGKTFTMDGTDDNPGVNLRALRQLFKMAEDRAPMFEYTIKVSIFEIYNEEIRDLIASAAEKKEKASADKNKKEGEYKVRHLPDGSVDIIGLTWIPVTSDADVVRLSNIAKKHRSAGVTDMNAHSSRSHMLLVVEVKGFNKPANIEYLGKLYLVDLAGSERVKKSGAVGQALKEAQNINSSLAALGDVMQALQEKRKFVPYRNSTLTDLMTNSLGGNAKTVMFINCCPTARHAFETVSSLKFASRVAKVELGQAKASAVKK